MHHFFPKLGIMPNDLAGNFGDIRLHLTANEITTNGPTF